MPQSLTQEKSEMRCGYSVIVGRPNVGKSTLFNRLLGTHLSPVTHKRQTTRCNIRGILSDDQLKTQVIFMDTPGMHSGHRRFNAMLNENAKNALHRADVLLLLTVAGEYTREDERLLEMIACYDKPCLLLINKVDRVPDKTSLLADMRDWSQRHPFRELLPLSALHDKNFSTLIRAVSAYLPESDFLFPRDWVSDQSLRFIATELIREQLMSGLNQELPYALHVMVEKFESFEDHTHLEALVLVQRETQKDIVLGAHGQRLKRLSARACSRLEALLAGPVDLDLRVKVKPGWQADPSLMSHYLEG